MFRISSLIRMIDRKGNTYDIVNLFSAPGNLQTDRSDQFGRRGNFAFPVGVDRVDWASCEQQKQQFVTFLYAL